MSEGQEIGLVTVVLAIVLIIGAIRGTWKAVFKALFSTPPSSGNSNSSGSGNTNIGGFPIGIAPPIVGTIPIPGGGTIRNPLPFPVPFGNTVQQ